MITVCPNITVLNIVTTDAALVSYVQMKHIKSVTVELEDCFGLGLLEFLENVGDQLEELSLSCSSGMAQTILDHKRKCLDDVIFSDSDSSFLPEGGQAFQLFNAGLKMARWLCYSRLKTFSIAGCGLVSNFLMNKLSNSNNGIQLPARQSRGSVDAKGLPILKDFEELESLIFLSYEDDQPMQTCEENLLFQTLQGCSSLKVLSLEGNFSTFLTDKFIRTLLNLNSMPKLEVLDFQGAPLNLTIASARAVMGLDNLKEIRLSYWNMTDQQITEIKDEVFRNGFDNIRLNRSFCSNIDFITVIDNIKLTVLDLY